MIAVAKEPTFALGDSAGISPTTLYTIIMVDTTCPDKRVLHYARANFKNNFDITNIDTKSAALFDYKAPGAFGEIGDDRQYSFLMYINPQLEQITSLKLPGDGEAFDVEKFQTDNGFQDATGGVGMVVKLGGQANCGGAQQSAVQSKTPSAAPTSSSAANAGSTSSAAGVSSGPRVTSTSTSVSQRASSAARASATPSSPSNNNDPSNGNNNASSAAGAQTSTPVAASSEAQTDTPAMSTVVLSSAGPEGGIQASRTPSASLAQQSTSSAITISANEYGMLASLFAIVGLAMW